jgi:multidrug efflux pump subunit AcrA (membrane-fusion protein)
MVATKTLIVALLALMANSERTIEPEYSSHARIERALVSLDKDIEVSSLAPGKLTMVEVREGDQVRTGDQVAQVDDREPQLKKRAAEIQLLAALTQARDEIPVIYARASSAVAKAEYLEHKEATEKVPGTVADATIRRLKLQVEESRLLIKKNEMERKVAQMNADVHQADVDSADEEIRRRRLLSDVDGLVVEVFRDKGEWVQAGDVVMRVVRMDRLRVEGFLNSANFDPFQIEGKPVTVRVELAQGRHAEFSGKIVFVSPIIQAKGNFLVRSEVENKQVNGSWVMRPGMDAEMEISLR